MTCSVRSTNVDAYDAVSPREMCSTPLVHRKHTAGVSERDVMGKVMRFETPAALRDASLASDFYSEWHRVCGALIRNDRRRLSGSGNSVDPSVVDLVVRERRTFTWSGFSRPLTMQNRDDRAAAFAAAEGNRTVQIEYLEWVATRDDDGKILAVDFLCETPEYYRTLAATDRDQLVSLYRRLVDDSVQPEDLFAGGTYQPENKWNNEESGVHYIMEINSMRDLLGVEQEFPTDPEGERRIEAEDGYDAVPYQRPTAADARISFDSWAIARRGLDVATADAPTLFMIDWDDTGFEKPDGKPVGDYWTVVRGVRGHALRLRYEVPDSEGFAVGDITIGGRPITTGGQIAEHIVVAATVVAGIAR